MIGIVDIISIIGKQFTFMIGLSDNGSPSIHYSVTTIGNITLIGIG